jgi:hypothetical protein
MKATLFLTDRGIAAVKDNPGGEPPPGPETLPHSPNTAVIADRTVVGRRSGDRRLPGQLHRDPH